MSSKFASGVCNYSGSQSLHRQEQIFARHDLEMPRSTTCDWMAAAAELLKPLYDEMVQEILQSRVLHTDDTRMSMQDKATPGKTTSTRFWTYVGDDEHPLTVFDFTLSRERDGPAAFLKRYSGVIQADGYSAYDGIAISGNNPSGGCWAHARRHFHDTQKTAPPVHYAEVMARIGRLFAIERDIKDQLETLAKQQGHPLVGAAADAVRLEIREVRTVPELEALRHFLDEQKKQALPKSPWGEAVNYALNQWDDLSLFTTVGSLAALQEWLAVPVVATRRGDRPRFDFMAFAAGEHAEEDGSGLASLGAFDEEPVASSQGDATW
ncbi:MAG: IS66 family transposase [Gemmatales bacterium]